MQGHEHVDVVVVGSGFGGAVAAERLARGGREVCVLERGKAYPPGSFPRSPRAMRDNFWDPAAGLHGMFHLWSFRGLEALVSSGLGGGSLIYANVLIRKDERWFVDEQPFGSGFEHWPVGRGDLDPHYDRVERMLGATPYPYPDTTPKTIAMRHAAEQLGADWRLPDLAITFAGADGEPRPGIPIPEGDYPNLFGLERRTCRLCGECDLGCNDGSKNTLDHTYLSSAAAAGADLRTRSEVRRIRPRDGGGYEVDYVVYGDEHEGQPTDLGALEHRTIGCDRLVLGAGAIATPYLLLRNRTNLPGLGDPLGSRFSGNGDLLTLAMRAREGGRPRVLDAARGPVITSAIRYPDAVDEDGDTQRRGYYIEDAGFPSFIDWVLETQARPSTVKRLVGFAYRRARARLGRDPDSDLSAEITEIIGDALMSTSSMPLLGMGRDVPDGRLTLRRGHLDVDWTTQTSRGFFDDMRSSMQEIAETLGAELRDNVLWRLRRVITVHPLGGAPMGRDADEGVVDAWGEAFGHPGLHVVDGAVMPGPVGPNPSLTIAAFADRAAERILETEERPAGRHRPSAEATAAPTAPDDAAAPVPSGATSLEFTEEMKGYVTLGADDHATGAREGRRDGTFLMFRLTIRTEDVDAFVADPGHEASAAGWVLCEALGGQLPVESGRFNLFVDTDDPDTKRMLYRLWFADSVGNPLTLIGHKVIHDDPGLDLWPDTSTLYVRVLQGHVDTPDDDGASVAAAGIITIHLKDFAEQLTTFRVSGPDPVAGLSAFGRLFLGELWDGYGARALEAAGVGGA